MERIYNLGVKDIFSVSGRGTLFLTDAVAKLTNLNYVATHHEQSAGFAAVAYAQYNNHLGVCLVSTGCGSTNAITPLLSAWQDGVPVLFISGQHNLKETSYYTGLNIRSYGQQETNIIKLVKPITKFATMVTEPSSIEDVINEALKQMMTGRKGPAWIDIPLDIQSAQIENSAIGKGIIDDKLTQKIENLEEFNLVKNVLNSSKKPMMLIGSGVRSSDAIEELKIFVEKNRIPVVFTPSAADIYGSKNTYSIGSVGAMGCSRAGNISMQQSDLLIIIGSKLNSQITGSDFENFAPSAFKVVVDIDREEHSKRSVKIDKFFENDAKYFLNQLIKTELDLNIENWIQECLFLKNKFMEIEKPFNQVDKIELHMFSKFLSNHLPEDAVLVTDSGLVELILPSNVAFSNSQRCLHPSSQGSMGYALPAAIGASFASKKDIFVVVGDGSIMMNLQELQTMKFNELPIKLFVLNNNAYSIIRKRQNELFRGRTIGTDSSNGLDCPDFNKIADSFGFDYIKIMNHKELQKFGPTVIKSNRPILCELIGYEDQNYVQIAPFKDDKGAIKKGLLEHQSPFI